MAKLQHAGLLCCSWHAPAMVESRGARSKHGEAGGATVLTDLLIGKVKSVPSLPDGAQVLVLTLR